MTQGIVIVPSPRKMEFDDGGFNLRQGQFLSIPIQDKDIVFTIAKRLKEIIRSDTNLELPICLGENPETGKLIRSESDRLIQPEWDGVIRFDRSGSLSGEAYSIEVAKNRIIVLYGDAAGAFHAVSTLKQIIRQSGKRIPCLRIVDEPDFKNRGIMIDISRNKIPTMKTLFDMIDFMADIKLNELQLYIEGFSFAYPSFPEGWKTGTPVTGEEMIELDRYCRERYIQLVPNQNSFGHMSPWLARKEFKNLAESPNGYIDTYGSHEPAGTLNPLDPQSLELVQKLYNDLLPNFTSAFFNVGCDESFELGEGKSKEACGRFGTGRVYLDYLLKIYHSVKQRNKTMMFWGDIIIKYPELIHALPKDMIALEWGYEEEHPYHENCGKYKEAGIPFYVCPGTSSWNSIAGRTENMKANLVSAAVHGRENGAAGFLNTDWGDKGHWQYQPISYASYAYGAGLSWNIQNNRDMDIGGYLDEFIFMDKKKATTQNILDMGNYYLLENCKIFNRTLISKILYSDLDEMKPLEGVDESVFTNIGIYIEEIVKRLDFAEMHSPDAVLVDGELRNTCRIVLHGARLAKLKILLKSGAPCERIDETAIGMISDMDEIMENHRKLWLARNRPGGLEESLKGMRHLKEQYEKRLMSATCKA